MAQLYIKICPNNRQIFILAYLPLKEEGRCQRDEPQTRLRMVGLAMSRTKQKWVNPQKF